MKKLIAILVVFALAATAVFAQADFSAGGAAVATLFSGDNSEKADDAPSIFTGFSSWFWFSAGKTNDENTMGAKAGLSISPTGDSINEGGDTWAYFWWQPIEQIFLKLGKVGEDGKYWAGAGVVGWDFQSNDLLISPAFGYYNGFAGSLLPDSHAFMDNGLGESALQLSILPIDGLAFNLGFNLGSDAEAVYLDGLAVQVVYDIPNIGQAAIGFVNGGETEYKDLYVQYKMPLGDMKFELGLHFAIEPENGAKAPFDIGLGFGYGSPWGDAFWLTARVGVSIGIEEYAPSIIGFDLCPSIDLGIFRVYVPVGIALAIPSADIPGDPETLFAWSFNPYIRKQMGGLEFWAGLKLYNGKINADGSNNNWYPAVADTVSQDQVNFAVPIGILWAW